MEPSVKRLKQRKNCKLCFKSLKSMEWIVYAFKVSEEEAVRRTREMVIIMQTAYLWFSCKHPSHIFWCSKAESGNAGAFPITSFAILAMSLLCQSYHKPGTWHHSEACRAFSTSLLDYYPQTCLRAWGKRAKSHKKADFVFLFTLTGAAIKRKTSSHSPEQLLCYLSCTSV